MNKIKQVLMSADYWKWTDYCR